MNVLRPVSHPMKSPFPGAGTSGADGILARYLVSLNLSILICKTGPVVSTLYRDTVRIP